ncbi:TonB-dependent siderophore receptor [Aquisalimonas sp.]|uniref:TonB-dependent receptor n=1 Tax=unclassified Aquisalimonas TaxID=2644645 RepID=UPI0025C526F0|nr:TonB-dependent siderophore receptor [Aquisalimonas sp.]
MDRVSPLDTQQRASGVRMRHGLVAAALLTATPLAHAGGHQSLAPLTVTPETTAPSGPLALDQPTSTGSRLGLTLEELPASATVIDSDTQRQRGVRTSREAVEAAPGFTAGEPPGSPGSFSSRGFTGGDIVVLHDGIREPGMSASTDNVWLYDRVEVLRGPASVLHGEGAIAGAINYVPRQPNPEQHEGDLLLSAGSFGRTWVAAGAGGPTDLDGLSYRVDASRLTSDGDIDRSGTRHDSLAGSLRYDASDRLRFTVSAQAEWDDTEPYFGTPVIDGGIDDRTVGNNYNVADAEMTMEGYWLRFDTEFAATERLRLRNRTYGHTGERTWKNVESYSYDPEEDVIERSVPIGIVHEQDLIGNRLEAVHDHTLFGLPHRVTVGTDISRTQFRHVNDSPYVGDDTVDVDNPDPGLYSSFSDTPMQPSVRTDNDRIALFGENRLSVGGGLHLIGGLRTEQIRLHGRDLREGTSDRERYTPTTGRLGAVWELPAGWTAYAQYATGAKPVSTPVTHSPARESQRLERSRAAEVGLRHRAWNDRLEWTLTAYDIAKRNLSVQDPENPDENRQIGRQESQGLELTMAVRPWDRWKFEADGTVLNAEYADYQSGDERFDGNTPPNVPERLANLRAHWYATDRLTLQTDLRYVGPRQGDDANTVDVPSYTLLGAAATWQFRSAEVTLRGRNLTDEQHVTWSSFNGSQWLLGESRSVDLTLSTHF